MLLQSIRLHSNERAYRTLVDRYFQRLLQQSQSILRCFHTAKEVVCDVFLKIWENRRRLQIKTKVHSYLRIAVRNNSIDRLRKRLRERNFKAQITLTMQPWTLSGEDQLIERELAKHIQQAIASLPPRGWYIFQFSRYEGKNIGK